MWPHRSHGTLTGLLAIVPVAPCAPVNGLPSKTRQQLIPVPMVT
jgi:hypothetical protein